MNMSDLKQIIAKNLVELRKMKKYTQQDLAEQLQYSDKAISKWEKGDSLPDIEVLYQICNLYGVTMDFLVHEGSYESKKEYIIPKYEIKNKIIISTMFIISVWSLGLIIFVSLLLLNTPIVFWPIFVLCIPVSAAMAWYFNLKWGKRLFNVFILTLMIWGFLASAYLFLIYFNINMWTFWPIFLLGIPLQTSVILWAQLKSE